MLPSARAHVYDVPLLVALIFLDLLVKRTIAAFAFLQAGKKKEKNLGPCILCPNADTDFFLLKPAIISFY